MSNDISTATCLDVDIGKQQVFLHGYATYGTKPYSALIATDKSRFAEGHNLLFIIMIISSGNTALPSPDTLDAVNSYIMEYYY